MAVTPERSGRGRVDVSLPNIVALPNVVALPIEVPQYRSFSQYILSAYRVVPNIVAFLI